MDKQLRRILDLVRRTGDRMVVTDSNGEDVYVVLGLDQYESLVSSVPTPEKEEEDNLWNHERWWEAGEEAYCPPVPPLGEETLNGDAVAPADIWEAMKPAGASGETWDLNKMSVAEKIDLEKQFQEYQKSKMIEKDLVDTKKVSESKAETVKTDDEFGEEQFYLEPVE